MTTFPNAKRDDWIASTTQAPHWFTTGRQPPPAPRLSDERLRNQQQAEKGLAGISRD